jgi:hypothetical protein
MAEGKQKEKDMLVNELRVRTIKIGHEYYNVRESRWLLLGLIPVFVRREYLRNR